MSLLCFNNLYSVVCPECRSSGVSHLHRSRAQLRLRAAESWDSFTDADHPLLTLWFTCWFNIVQHLSAYTIPPDHDQWWAATTTHHPPHYPVNIFSCSCLCDTQKVFTINCLTTTLVTGIRWYNPRLRNTLHNVTVGCLFFSTKNQWSYFRMSDKWLSK